MLRPIRQSDFDQIRAWAAREELGEYFRRFPPLISWPDDISSWFNAGSFVVTDKETGAGLGLLQFSSHDPHGQKIEFGLMIDPTLCEDRQALAIEVTRAAFEYAFYYLKVNKIVCVILAHRDGLKSLLNHYSFTHEGTLRQNLSWKGVMHDECVFALLKEEFEQVKNICRGIQAPANPVVLQEVREVKWA